MIYDVEFGLNNFRLFFSVIYNSVSDKERWWQYRDIWLLRLDPAAVPVRLTVPSRL